MLEALLSSGISLVFCVFGIKDISEVCGSGVHISKDVIVTCKVWQFHQKVRRNMDTMKHTQYFKELSEQRLVKLEQRWLHFVPSGIPCHLRDSANCLNSRDGILKVTCKFLTCKISTRFTISHLTLTKLSTTGSSSTVYDLYML